MESDVTPRVGRWKPLIGIAAVWVILDQATKWWALHNLDEPKPLFWTLRLNLSFNSGMAFSKGRGLGPLIGLGAVIIVVVLVRVSRTMTGRLGTVALALVLGGAIGNLTDRLLRAQNGLASGHVVDFIDPQWFPIFNVADAGIVVGAIFLAVSTLKGESDRDREPADGATVSA